MVGRHEGMTAGWCASVGGGRQNSQVVTVLVLATSWCVQVWLA